MKKKEHTVHFKIIRGSQTEMLTGLLFLAEGTEPSTDDYIKLLAQCGHEVAIEDEERFIFRSTKPGEKYLIDVLEDYSPNKKDLASENLAKSFMKPRPFL